MWYLALGRLRQNYLRVGRPQVLELELLEPDAFHEPVRVVGPMRADPPVRVDVDAVHRGDLLADAAAWQAARELQQAKDHQRDVAGEEVRLDVLRRPDVDGARLDLGLGDLEGLLDAPELPVRVDDAVRLKEVVNVNTGI